MFANSPVKINPTPNKLSNPKVSSIYIKEMLNITVFTEHTSTRLYITRQLYD